MGLSWAAWVFAVVAVQHCSLVRMGPVKKNYDSLEGFGYFRRAYYDEESNDFLGCISYQGDTHWSATFEVSLVFGVALALIMTITLLLVNMMILFVCAHGTRRRFHCLLRVLVPCAWACSVLTLGVFSMDECKDNAVQCPPGAAGIVAMINTFVLGVLALLLFLMPTPKQPVFVSFVDTRTRPHKRVSFQDPVQEGEQDHRPSIIKNFKDIILPGFIDGTSCDTTSDSSLDECDVNMCSPDVERGDILESKERTSQLPPFPAPLDNGFRPRLQISPRSPRSTRPALPTPAKTETIQFKERHPPPPEMLVAASSTKVHTSSSPRRTLHRQMQSPRSPRSPVRTKKYQRNEDEGGPLSARCVIRQLPPPPLVSEEKYVNVQVDLVTVGRRIITTVTHEDGSKTVSAELQELTPMEREHMEWEQRRMLGAHRSNIV